MILTLLRGQHVLILFYIFAFTITVASLVCSQ